MSNQFTIQEQMQVVEQPVENNTEEIHVYNSEEILQQRQSTCFNCEFITEDRHCSQCGCPVIMMAQFNFKTCPKGKW